MVPFIAVASGGEIRIKLPNADERQLRLLVDRVRAAVCRSEGEPECLELGVLQVDFVRRQVRGAARPVRLTGQEFELLRYLALRRNTVVTRDELLRAVWRYADAPLTRSVDNAVARLRKKIEPCPRQPVFIHTVHGDGYCLVTEAESR